MTTLKFNSHQVKLAFAALLLILSISQGHAQYSISGKVADKNTKATLSGAHILLRGTFLHSVTDAQGKFRISGLQKGSHILVVTYLGYQDFVKEVVIDGDVTMDILLEPLAFLSEEVVITATRAGEKTASTYSRIENREIVELNTGRDLPYILERSPSVVTTSDAGTGIGYTNLRIRGTDMNRINVTMNGIPLNDAESHGMWFVDLPDLASSIDNIQVQRGVGTSSNGSAAFGASINLATNRLNDKAFIESGNTFGSFNTFRNYIKTGTGLINGKWAAEARLSKISSDGYIDRSSSDLKSISASLGYYGSNDLLRFNLISGTEKTGQAWDGIPASILDTNRTYNGMGAYYDPDGKLRYYDNETDNYQQDHYQLFYSRQVGVHILNLALHYTRGFGYYEQYKDSEDLSSYGLPDLVTGADTITTTDLIRRKYLDNDFYGFTASINLKPSKKIELIAGGGWNHYLGDHYGEVIWAEYAAGMGKDYRWYEGDGDKKDFNFYTRVMYDLGKNAGLFADIQYRGIDYTISGIDDDLRDIGQNHTFGFFNPKAGVWHQLSERQKVYASFAVSNREPNRDNYTDTEPGMPEPKPERLNNLEAGYTYHAKKVKVQANIYLMNYKDQLVLTGKINDVGNPVMTNVDKSYRHGIEVSFETTPVKWFNCMLNATLSRNRIKDFTDWVVNFNDYPFTYIPDEIGETNIAFSPSVVAGSHLTFILPKNLRINLDSRYVGKQYIDNSGNDDRSLDAYLVNDLGFYYVPEHRNLPEIRFYFRVNNVLDHEYESNAWVYRYYYGGEYYEDNGFFPQAGRHFMVGVDVRF